MSTYPYGVKHGSYYWLIYYGFSLSIKIITTEKVLICGMIKSACMGIYGTIKIACIYTVSINAGPFLFI